jgi:FkbH-like protein
MTTRRYQEEDILSFAGSGSYLVVCLSVDDKFGESGLTGVAILEKGKESWRIDTLLLSCRVLGRRIEYALIAVIMREARENGARMLTGEFIPTKKNAPASDFYRKAGFRLTGKEGEKEIWEYDLDRVLPVPDFIQVVRE